jgi:DNA polymerase I-like protein with 3'-5' exonuclease and polymerase domains
MKDNNATTPTGRAASQSPEMQPFPVSTEEGKRIRAAFVDIWKGLGRCATEGDREPALAADYEQAELRTLAHIVDSK